MQRIIVEIGEYDCWCRVTNATNQQKSGSMRQFFNAFACVDVDISGEQCLAWNYDGGLINY